MYHGCISRVWGRTHVPLKNTVQQHFTPRHVRRTRRRRNIHVKDVCGVVVRVIPPGHPRPLDVRVHDENTYTINHTHNPIQRPLHANGAIEPPRHTRDAHWDPIPTPVQVPHCYGYPSGPPRPHITVQVGALVNVERAPPDVPRGVLVL